MTRTDVDQIEITPEMIEAGAEILWVFDRDRDSPYDTAKEVFTAMASAYRAGLHKLE